jgi:hypothetical protein
VLLALPKSRIDRLLADMDGPLIARLLLAADPARRAALVRHLGANRLSAELTLLPIIEAASVLAALPPDWAGPQLDRLTVEQLSTLLDAMPAADRDRLAATLDPHRSAGLRRIGYEKAVIESLRRTNVALEWVPGEHGAHLFVTAFQRHFGVAVCYVDGGPLPVTTVAVARQVFAEHRVDGLLIVTNVVPAAAADPHGVPARTVAWEPGDNDGVLARALVRIAGS